IQKSDGSLLAISDIQNIDQTLDLWKGELISRFEVEGVPVEVISFVSQRDDRLGVKITSALVKEGRIGLNIHFPYPTDNFLDEAVHFDLEEPKRLNIRKPGPKQVEISRHLDSTRYFTHLSSSSALQSAEATDKGFRIMPAPDQE